MEKWLEKRYIRQAALELWEGGDNSGTIDALMTEQGMTEYQASTFLESNHVAIRNESRKLNEWLDGGGEIEGV